MQQGTEAWIESRLGYATASCFKSILAKGSGKTRAAYLEKVVTERLTGVRSVGFSSPDTFRGVEQEPLARLAYEAETGNVVQEVGFIRHETLLAGASADGLIDKDGGLEIKCVLPEIQMKLWSRGKYPSTHKPQIHGGMWICKRQWWDFVSYSPGLPQEYRLYIYRVERDEEYITNLESEVTRFLVEAEAQYNLLKEV